MVAGARKCSGLRAPLLGWLATNLSKGKQVALMVRLIRSHIRLQLGIWKLCDEEKKVKFLGSININCLKYTTLVLINVHFQNLRNLKSYILSRLRDKLLPVLP